jgi:hypothetical protein
MYIDKSGGGGDLLQEKEEGRKQDFFFQTSISSFPSSSSQVSTSLVRMCFIHSIESSFLFQYQIYIYIYIYTNIPIAVTSKHNAEKKADFTRIVITTNECRRNGRWRQIPKHWEQFLSW